ncbi:MAG: hypothetical protein LBF12_04930 [Christensenellaceae bacterium]|jgi:hypothetical protein|nr:hypothetical protein [Christensenellaceae bacterium]
MKQFEIKKSMFFGTTILIVFLLILCVLFYQPTRIAVALQTPELDPQDLAIWFNPENAFPTYELAAENREVWASNDQEERFEYYLFKTDKEPHNVDISSITAYHTKGYETTLQIGFDKLTSEEVLYSFGIDAEIKVGFAIGKFGGGWKWGETTSRKFAKNGTFVISAEKEDQLLKAYASGVVQEYYLYVRKVTRKVNKDKHGNFVSHSDYSTTKVPSESGFFETFDFDASVTVEISKV